MVSKGYDFHLEEKNRENLSLNYVNVNRSKIEANFIQNHSPFIKDIDCENILKQTFTPYKFEPKILITDYNPTTNFNTCEILSPLSILNKKQYINKVYISPEEKRPLITVLSKKKGRPKNEEKCSNSEGENINRHDRNSTDNVFNTTIIMFSSALKEFINSLCYRFKIYEKLKRVNYKVTKREAASINVTEYLTQSRKSIKTFAQTGSKYEGNKEILESLFPKLRENENGKKVISFLEGPLIVLIKIFFEGSNELKYEDIVFRGLKESQELCSEEESSEIYSLRKRYLEKFLRKHYKKEEEKEEKEV